MGERHAILELPPATLSVAGVTVPMGGGGYFRLFPLWLTERALRQTAADCRPPVATLYFHPWEFDPDQARLPLRGLNRFRTYVGLARTRRRLARASKRAMATELPKTSCSHRNSAGSGAIVSLALMRR